MFGRDGNALSRASRGTPALTHGALEQVLGRGTHVPAGVCSVNPSRTAIFCGTFQLWGPSSGSVIFSSGQTLLGTLFAEPRTCLPRNDPPLGSCEVLAGTFVHGIGAWPCAIAREGGLG